MVEELVISTVGHRGDGVAAAADGPVFVPFALPGEIVRVARDSNSDRGTLIEIVKPSSDRVTPACLHFGACGGCALQHWSNETIASWKHDFVAHALRQARVSAQVDPVVDAHGAGRRRAVFHARTDETGRMVFGFSAAREHRLVPLDTCPLLAPDLARALPLLRTLAQIILSGIPKPKPLDLHATATIGGLDIDVRGSGPFPPALAVRLAAERLPGVARLTRHGELVVQHAAPRIAVGAAIVALPPHPFLQPTAAGEEALARLVLTHLGSARRAADLFCGIGPFALRLAQSAPLVAFDSDRPAVEALRAAAARTHGLRPVEAHARDLFRRPLTPDELRPFDAVVLDPPRAGADAQVRALVASAVARVAMVSCNPATFARDAATLVAGGFELECVTPVDQFRYSAHVELVGAFVRARMRKR